ncbi:Chondroitin polymerase [uncultured Clostridium sp.]|nr:Chondroitin polymerase [uncultured Clostridium sp.]
MKMNEPLFSVILPVHDTRDYLDECLNSALTQSLDDFELICIDNGSTDGSEALLDRYAQQDARMQVFHQMDRGLSNARNVGLAAARGRYIAFLDSDDVLKPQALQRMYAAMSSGTLDLLCFEFDILPEKDGWTMGDGSPQAWRRQREHPGLMDGGDMFVDMYRVGDYRCMVWALCLSRKFLLQTGLHFEEGIINEDEIFTLNALLKARRTRHLYESLYVYRLRKGSLMQTASRSPLGLRSRLRVLEEQIALCSDPGLPATVRECVVSQAQALVRDTQRRFAVQFSSDGTSGK